VFRNEAQIIGRGTALILLSFMQDGVVARLVVDVLS
jgi:hypothetical protein